MRTSRILRTVVAAAALAAAPLVTPGSSVSAQTAPAGYWLVASDGGIFSYGDAGFFGSTGAITLNQPITGMTSSPSGRGYWMVASDGGIFSFGDAAFFGSTGSIKLNRPIVGMAATPSGRGYWLVASDGGIFAFGDAAFFGSTGSIRLNRPIVGMASTPTGKGYWLVASDGGIFSYGDAAFFGSTGSIKLAQPITAMAATPTGAGYWMTATDGGVFAFGDAGFFGSGPERAVRSGDTRRVVAMVPTATGKGYWQVSASGELLAFGDAPALGGPAALNRPLVGMAGVIGRAAAPGPSGPAPGSGSNPSNSTPTTTGPPPVPWTPPQHFSSQPNPTWGTSVENDKAGRILALAEVGDKIFIGGEHLMVVPPGRDGTAVSRPFLAALDVRTGALLDWDAHPDDAVLSLVASPDGKRLYVGGRFRSIGGGVSPRLAAIDVASGLLDQTFRPPQPGAGVKALALSGNTLFLGGAFQQMGDITRPVAAVNATNGALLSSWVPPSNTGGRYQGQTGSEVEDGDPGLIYDLAVTGDGRTLLVVGDFLHFGDQGGVLALDVATGKKASWQPTISRPVYGVTSWPGDGKSFYIATGGTGGQVQSFTVGGSSKPRWVHKVDGDAMDVVATTERLYLVGHYDFVLGDKTVCGQPPCTGSEADGDTPNRHVSAFDARSGAHDLSFDAQLNTPQGPYVALIGADHLYIGGDFTKVNLKPQPGFVQFPAIR